MIGHVVILSGFRYRPYLVQLVMVAQFHFWHKPHLHDQSRCFLVWFSSQTTLGRIGLNSSILVSTQTQPIQLITSLSYPIFIIDHTQFDQSQELNFVFSIDHICIIGHDHSVSFLAYTIFLRAVTSLSYLVFVKDCTWSDQS